MSDEDAERAFRAVCGSTRWVSLMVKARPFDDLSALHARAQTAWRSLDRADWLEAFAAHPRIGETAQKVRDDRVWSQHEQHGMDAADDRVRERFVALNREYEARFGYIFIVCATGRTAGEMLSALDTRLSHTTDEELPIAAAEQAQIIRLRLDTLCRP